MIAYSTSVPMFWSTTIYVVKKPKCWIVRAHPRNSDFLRIQLVGTLRNHLKFRNGLLTLLLHKLCFSSRMKKWGWPNRVGPIRSKNVFSCSLKTWTSSPRIKTPFKKMTWSFNFISFNIFFILQVLYWYYIIFIIW